MIFESTYFLISMASKMPNELAWGIVFGVVGFSVLGLIWNIIRKPLSHFMKVKEAYVRVVYVPEDRFTKSFITVRFLDTKRKKRKVFYMNADDIYAGEKGILHYQGVYGLGFKADIKIVQKDYHQKFGFAKKKKEDAAIKPKQRTHHKRKYW